MLLLTLSIFLFRRICQSENDQYMLSVRWNGALCAMRMPHRTNIGITEFSVTTCHTCFMGLQNQRSKQSCHSHPLALVATTASPFEKICTKRKDTLKSGGITFCLSWVVSQVRLFVFFFQLKRKWLHTMFVPQGNSFTCFAFAYL